MPQLDLVSFPSQVFWLLIFFIIFYSFVSGHFVPLIHKIVQTRSKKVSMSQDSASGQLEAQTSARAESEGFVVATFDKSVSGLSSCSQEAEKGQGVELQSGDKSNIGSLSSVVYSIQGRYLVSRGALFPQII
jgi:F-type H+-transporting ATPase subunit b